MLQEPQRASKTVPATTEITDQRAAAAKPSHRWLRWYLWLLVLGGLLVFGLLHWGGYLLIATDPLPADVEVAVALQGSIQDEKLRIAAAMSLLRSDTAQRVLLSVPRESYWGQSLPPIARQYLEKQYGQPLASRVDFCETGPEVDSTEEEAQSLIGCIKEHNWKEILVVTSNYHTRRAGIIWRRAVRRELPSAQVYVYAAADPDFTPEGYWRHRRSLKTWFMESLKLASLMAGS